MLVTGLTKPFDTWLEVPSQKSIFPYRSLLNRYLVKEVSSNRQERRAGKNRAGNAQESAVSEGDRGPTRHGVRKRERLTSSFKCCGLYTALSAHQLLELAGDKLFSKLKQYDLTPGPDVTLSSKYTRFNLISFASRVWKGGRSQRSLDAETALSSREPVGLSSGVRSRWAFPYPLQVWTLR